MKPPDWSNCSEKELWEYVAWHLSMSGIDSVLVGGAVVAIYTEGLYQSSDLDMVPDEFERHRIAGVLAEIGFIEKGRYFAHPACSHLYVEFPLGPVELGDECPVDPDKIMIEGKALQILSPTSCVKDRLAGYIHWKTRDLFDQAVLVCLRQSKRIHWQELKRWCAGENSVETYDELRRAVERAEV
jgi:hypothetical protein